MSDWSSDRLVDGAELEPGATVDIDQADTGPLLEGYDDDPLLDSEGRALRELDLDRPDALAGRGATVRQLAVDEQVWRFGHVIVDEAQDLTPMQWRMLVRRSRSGAVTILGDLAQRSLGRPGTWDDHLPPELTPHDQRDLTINYRSPAEINDLAAAVLARLAPDLGGSRAVRRSGHPPEMVPVADLDRDLPAAVADTIARWSEGTDRAVRPAVIGLDLPAPPRSTNGDAAGAGAGTLDGCRLLSPWRAKGLEFDAVIVVEPARFLDEPHGLSLLYVALTRSTDRLAVIHQRPLPDVLAPS